MKTVTMADVAKHAQVSKSTVSQYLNKRYDYMGEKTKLRIEQAIYELGYQPNIIARSLKQKSTKTIGVIVANILHNFSTEVSRAIEDACNRADFHTIICNADDDPAKEKKYIEMLRAKQVDGLIIFPTGNNRDLYQKMLDENYPVVFVDRSVEGIPVSSVMLENERASEMAIDYFVNKGQKRIAIITASMIEDVSPRLERMEGYKKALQSHKLAILDEYIKSVEPDQVEEALQEMMALDQPPEAILAGNDLVLKEVLQFAKLHHLNIAEDLSVIGIDDVPYASFYTPPITTVAQPTFKMGKMAGEVLLDKINKKKTTDERPDYRFEPTLMVRESVKEKGGYVL
ncbi:substrate-binding domain-containing protein [Halobacillus shinanisalinarum]|uniref:Substrate-binding domain-containing protein n=1 Tax=Halobacillus shinanisalinarum TaxID=2932258 RepID=A0ABY4H4K5_9BACI|nr:substrate-binding domain-containing protein [Halobacillus shinanisalinarum]UOQ95289.1 substrate-binding domain-containing protein [Halobacillus shinanisalinarum]